MDIEKFTQLVNDPTRSKANLQQMMKNALQKGKHEYAAITKEVLDTRFPGWNEVKTGGATPTRVSFRSTEKIFPTAKNAYIWLIERFITVKPELFADVNWETEFFAKGKKRNYFGRSPKKMFRSSPHLADDPNNYKKLPNNWYVNLNLSNAQKFEILCKFAAITKLRYKEDWQWEVIGNKRSSDAFAL